MLRDDTHWSTARCACEGRRLWVNPGLAPGFIASRRMCRLHAYQVRPRVFGATPGVQGAVTVRTARTCAPRARSARVSADIPCSAPPRRSSRRLSVPRRRRSARANAGSSAAIRRAPRKAGRAPQQQQQTTAVAAACGVPPRTGPAPVTTPTTPRPPAPGVAPVQPTAVGSAENAGAPRVCIRRLVRGGTLRPDAGGPPPQPQDRPCVGRAATAATAATATAARSRMLRRRRRAVTRHQRHLRAVHAPPPPACMRRRRQRACARAAAAAEAGRHPAEAGREASRRCRNSDRLIGAKTKRAACGPPVACPVTGAAV